MYKRSRKNGWMKRMNKIFIVFSLSLSLSFFLSLTLSLSIASSLYISIYLPSRQVTVYFSLVSPFYIHLFLSTVSPPLVLLFLFSFLIVLYISVFLFSPFQLCIDKTSKNNYFLKLHFSWNCQLSVDFFNFSFSRKLEKSYNSTLHIQRE